MRSTRAHCLRQSFTLIELLVVVTVALVFLAFASAFVFSSMERANRISCMNHLKQIVIAVQLYGAEHNFLLPQQAVYDGSYESDWSGLLTNGYLGSPGIFKCPSDENARRTNFNGRAWRSYCINGSNSWVGAWEAPYKWPWPAPEETPRRLSEIPLHVILIGENHGIDGATPPGMSGAVVGISEMESLAGHASAMHREIGSLAVASTDDENGGGNYGYADGRVEFHLRSKLRNPNGSFTGGHNDPWKWR